MSLDVIEIVDFVAVAVAQLAMRKQIATTKLPFLTDQSLSPHSRQMTQRIWRSARQYSVRSQWNTHSDLKAAGWKRFSTNSKRKLERNHLVPLTLEELSFQTLDMLDDGKAVNQFMILLRQALNDIKSPAKLCFTLS
jgi:hypothetical protein